MKLLPFDLTKAQAGHPWGTRDGRKGKKIFDTERDGGLRLIAVFEDNTQFCNCIDGSYLLNESESDYDLFLFVEPKKLWIVVFEDNSGYGSYVLSNEKAAIRLKEKRKADGTYLQTVEVEY